MLVWTFPPPLWTNMLEKQVDWSINDGWEKKSIPRISEQKKKTVLQGSPNIACSVSVGASSVSW